MCHIGVYSDGEYKCTPQVYPIPVYKYMYLYKLREGKDLTVRYSDKTDHGQGPDKTNHVSGQNGPRLRTKRTTFLGQNGPGFRTEQARFLDKTGTLLGQTGSCKKIHDVL